MEKENNMNDELYANIKANMKAISKDELKKMREELIKSGKMNQKLLEIFNEELLDRTCEETSNKMSK